MMGSDMLMISPCHGLQGLMLLILPIETRIATREDTMSQAASAPSIMLPDMRDRDPVLTSLAGEPDLDHILGLFARPLGDPAFDPDLIASNVERLRTVP